jgi:transcriptional regulator with XRE-family HTH domain
MVQTTQATFADALFIAGHDMLGHAMTMNVFAKRLRSRIKERDLTYAEFARRVGINPERLNHWIGPRQSEPDFEMFLRICAELETHPNYLLGVSDRPEPQFSDEMSRLRALEDEVRALRQVLRHRLITNN